MSDETREAIIDALVMSPMSDFIGTSMAPVERTADQIMARISGLVVPAAIHKVATDALEAGDACGAVGCRALVDRDDAVAKLESVRALAKKWEVEYVGYWGPGDGDEGDYWSAELHCAQAITSALDGTTP